MMALAVMIMGITLAAIAFLMFFKEKALAMSIREELYRTRQEKDIVIEFLHKTAGNLGEDAEGEKLYALIVRATALGCGAMSACVYERNPDGSLTAKAVEGLFPPQTRKIGRPPAGESRTHFLESVINNETVEPNEGVIGAVAHDAKGILIKDATRDPRIIKHDDDSLHTKSLIVVPMTFGGQMHGVLAVANPISGKSFTDTDFSLACSLGEQAGVALHHKEAVSALLQKNKLDFDLRLASSVQQYLLPRTLPENNDLDFAVKYIPQQLIGGDFYDCFKLPDERIGMVIGDVSGKGISAAILMAICQTKLRYIAMTKNTPSETLVEVNRELVNSMRMDMFITIIYAIIEKDASKITLARAGHERPLLYRAEDKSTTEIMSPGMAVGMAGPEIFDNSIKDIEIAFARGDMFVTYTDGLTEATNASMEEFSSERLSNTVTNLGTRSASDMADEIISAVNKFTHRKSEFKDDLTLLAVKRI